VAELRGTALHGKAAIGQSGGPTHVINQTLVGAVLEACRHPRIEAVLGARHGIDGMLTENFVDLGAESVANLELIARTPSAALGSVRKKPKPEDVGKLIQVFRKHDIRFFFYIGGNDSAETAHIVRELSRKEDHEIAVCHLPKTIDNDLCVTDHCPGFGSAARFVALAFIGDNLDNRSLGGVKINVVMGRHAGFLTAASVLGRESPDDGPHFVYVPEVPFRVERFLADVKQCYEKHKRCIVAVSEGVADENHKTILPTTETDSHGNAQLSGTGALGDYLAQLVRKELGISRVRSDTFGYMQRCFPTVASEIDMREARGAGEYGVQRLMRGETSGSVVLRRTGEGDAYAVEFDWTDLANVAGKTRTLDSSFIAAAGNDITKAFVHYAAPLVGPLPAMGRLSMIAPR
jgi:6-phosphofructokinase